MRKASPFKQDVQIPTVKKDVVEQISEYIRIRVNAYAVHLPTILYPYDWNTEGANYHGPMCKKSHQSNSPETHLGMRVRFSAAHIVEATNGRDTRETGWTTFCGDFVRAGKERQDAYLLCLL